MNLLDLMIKVGVDDQATSGLDEIVGNVKSTAEKLSTGFKTALDVGAKISTVAAGAFAALSGAGLKATGELEQNTGGMTQVFKEYATDMESTAKTAYTNMGLSASDFMATANKMGALFQGSGFSIAESADLSAKAMQRAADVASIMGSDIFDAMESVTGAAKGNFTMMDNLGVAINDTTIAQYALSKGITKTTREMTTQEKVGLAMELFLEKTTYATGNYARENETLAGSLATAKAALNNFLSGAGSASDVIDSVTNAAKVTVRNIKDIVPRLAEGIGEIAGGLAGEIPELFEAVIPAVASGAKALLDGIITTVRESAGTILQTVVDTLYEFTGIDLNPVVEPLKNVASLIKNTLGKMLDGVDLAGIGEKINGFLSGLGGAITWVLDAVQGDTFKGFLSDLQVFFGHIKSGLQTILKPVADGIRGLFQSFADGDFGTIQSIANAFGSFAEWFDGTLAPTIGAVAAAVIKLLGGFAEKMIEPIKNIVGSLVILFSSATGKDGVLSTISDAVVSLLGAFAEDLAGVVEGVTQKIIDFAGKLSEKETDVSDFNLVIQKLVEWFKELFDYTSDTLLKLTDLGLEIMDLDGDWEAAWKDMVEVAESSSKLIITAIEGIVTALGKLYSNKLLDFFELVSQNFEGSALGDFFSVGEDKATGGGSYSQKYASAATTKTVTQSESVAGISTAALANMMLNMAGGSGSKDTQQTPVVFQINGRTFAAAVLPDLQETAKQQGVKVVVGQP